MSVHKEIMKAGGGALAVIFIIVSKGRVVGKQGCAPVPVAPGVACWHVWAKPGQSLVMRVSPG